MENNRNYFVAIALSVAILFGWQYFYMQPKLDAQRAQIAAQKTEAAAVSANQTNIPAANASTSAELPGGTQKTATADRATVIANSARIKIDTPSLVGSINLKGSRLDDLSLKGYHETVDNSSPMITLLNPAETSDGYFAETGYIGAENLPGPSTVWTAPANSVLTENSPVTLTYDNGKGLLFSRTISVDKHYMFKVEDKVTNSSGQAVSLGGYGRVTRYNKPAKAISYLIHQGFVGWIGKQNSRTLF